MIDSLLNRVIWSNTRKICLIQTVRRGVIVELAPGRMVMGKAPQFPITSRSISDFTWFQLFLRSFWDLSWNHSETLSYDWNLLKTLNQDHRFSSTTEISRPSMPANISPYHPWHNINYRWKKAICLETKRRSYQLWHVVNSLISLHETLYSIKQIKKRNPLSK